MKMNAFRLLFMMIACAGIGCSKKDNSTPHQTSPITGVYTDEPDSITATSALFFGSVSGSNDFSTVTAWGFCWSTDSLPTLSNHVLTVPLTEELTADVSSLDEQTTYHVRAYATNAVGTTYGNSRPFTTLSLKPVVRTKDIYSVSSDYAFIDGEVLSQGNAPIITFGICWSTHPNPTISDDTTMSGPDAANFFGELDGLTVNTKYYVRAYATNQYGTGYGDTLSLTTAYYIGEKFEGGKIFYIDRSKEHGLIVANEDQSAGARWFNGNTAIWTYAWDTDNGAPNTNKIISVQGNGSYAAIICRNYTGGGYTDWYLPSLDELGDLFVEKSVIGNITPYYYWSSTESSTDIASAWVIRMDSQTGEQQTWTKNYQFVVRAVRSF